MVQFRSLHFIVISPNRQDKCLEVEELDARECGALNGGISPWVGFVAAYVLVEAALNPRAHAKAFMEGWNSI